MPAAPPPPDLRFADLDAIYLAGALAAPEVQEGLNEWRQGDLLRGVALFWAGTTDSDPITGLAVPASGGHQWPVVPWDGVPAQADADGLATFAATSGGNSGDTWAVITSQTCDVVASGPGGRHPTVQVSPLVNLDGADPNKVTGIRRNMNVDMVLVPDVPGGGTWAADLRISLPVSKAVLLQQSRVPGFLAPAEAQQFAERVAAKYRRPALHDQVSGDLVWGLQALVKQAKKAKALWPDLIEQFRLLVTAGDKLNPSNVTVLALTLGDKLSPEDMAPLRTWRTAERKRLLKVSDIQLDPVRFRTIETVGVRDYRESDWLRVTELGQPVFW